MLRNVSVEPQSLEGYGNNGIIVEHFADGGWISFTYSNSATPPAIAPKPNYLLTATDNFGRSVSFSYTTTPVGVVVSTITGSDDLVYTFSYDSVGNLTSILSPGSSSPRVFIYGEGGGSSNLLYDLKVTDNGLYFTKDIYLNPSNWANSKNWALTGIVDENGVQYASFGYDSEGRAISTERYGATNKFSATYSGQGPTISTTLLFDSPSRLRRLHNWNFDGGVSVQWPTTGQIEDFSPPNLSFGYPRDTGRSQPAGAGCAASTSAQTYDANGNTASKDDFNGTRACYAHDLSRNLETTRIEGLANTAVCSSVTPANAALPVGSRKTSTTWHPDWRLETKRAEAGRITTSVYNGQPDPFNANAIASCAPAAALLPDGKPIAVLCKQVEQATTDANGSQGFGATLQPGVTNRATSWTYNQYGQALTEDGPRTDVSDITTYAYYTDTAFTGTGASAEGHTLGDLQTMTNAAGKVTQYTKYNKHGQLLESIDPNGVVTVNTYDLRQRLLSTSVGGQTTSYTYDAVGQLTRVTQPDASYIGYEYDAAHRQKAVFDNRGNRIDYVLDNAGIRTAENVKDPSGALRRTLSRSIDALGRVQQTTGRE